MATTKVIPEVIDLNQASSESGLRMPKGSAAYAAPPTVAEGMMRNEFLLLLSEVEERVYYITEQLG